MRKAIERKLTRAEQRKKAVVLECYRDFWRRSQHPVCQLSEAEAYLVRAADIVVRVRAMVTPEGDTGSPDGTAVVKAQSEEDVERAVLECVNHAAMGGNSAEMLWDLEQCPAADPAAFVRALVHATLRDADKYTLPSVDADLINRFVDAYDALRPFGAATDDEVSFAELEAVLASMQKTTAGLMDVEVPKQPLKEIVNSLRDIDEKLAGFLPKPKKQEVTEGAAPAPAAEASDASSPEADTVPATRTDSAASSDSMLDESFQAHAHTPEKGTVTDDDDEEEGSAEEEEGEEEAEEDDSP